jgi:hypothetical protein
MREASPCSATSPANDHQRYLALVAAPDSSSSAGSAGTGVAAVGCRAAGVWRYQLTSPEMRLTEPDTMTTPKR